MRVRHRAPVGGGIQARRERLANNTAKQLVGIWYGLLALHIEPRALKRSLDWHGVIGSLSVELRRYADGEPRALLEGRDDVL